MNAWELYRHDLVILRAVDDAIAEGRRLALDRLRLAQRTCPHVVLTHRNGGACGVCVSWDSSGQASTSRRTTIDRRM